MVKAAESPGSDRAELKKLLVLARRQPIHMAFCLGADGRAMVKLDRLKKPRALEKTLKEGGGAKTHRHGTVEIDPDNPKMVRFVVNKEVGGFARRLVLALKGTGFNKVAIVSEDGSPLEDAWDEDDEDAEPGADGAYEVSQIASFDEPRGDGAYEVSQIASFNEPPPDAEGADYDADATDAEDAQADSQDDADGQDEENATPALDKTALSSELAGLVKRIMAVIARDPSQKAGLVQLATDAQASLKRDDLAQAAAGIDILRQALEAVAPPDGSGQTETPSETTEGEAASPPLGGPDPRIIQKIHKSRAVWDATLAKLHRDIGQLTKAVAAVTADHEIGATFEAEFQTVIEPLLATLDHRLSALLAQAADARDAEEHARIMAEARATLAVYMDFVRSHPVIGHIDENPFATVAVGNTLNTTLAAISAIIR